MPCWKEEKKKIGRVMPFDNSAECGKKEGEEKKNNHA